jgi:ATP-binding cassette, subfamily C (CFTR/MRP), member 1
MYRVTPKSGIEFHRKILQTVIKAPLSIVTGNHDGSIINRFNQDMMLIDMTLPLDLFNTAAELFTSSMQIVLISISSVYMVAVIFFTFIAIFCIQKFYVRTSKQLRHLELETKAPLHAQFISTCAGLSTIRAFGWQEETIHHFSQYLDNSQKPLYLLYSAQRWLQLVLNLQTTAIIIVVVGAAVGLRAKANVAAMGVAFSNISTVTETLTNLIISWTSLETSLGAVARTLSFCKSTPIEKDEFDQNDNAAYSIDGQTLLSMTDGNLEFRNVWVGYRDQPGSDATRIAVLRGVNFSIPLGQRLAICGPSGSGKSTLLLSFLSLVGISQGAMCINGRSILAIPRSLRRRDMVVVPQESAIIADSIRKALVHDNNAFRDTEIEEVLQQCFMAEKVQRIGGIDARISPDTFSFGEGQLLSLAAAILKSRTTNSRIVIIDDITSRYVHTCIQPRISFCSS